MKADLPPDTESLAADLQGIVGHEHVLSAMEDREEYAFDASSPDRAKRLLGHDPPLPHLAIRPGSTHEVQEIVRLANAQRVPIVPFGGGTGVMGAAVPTRPCIVLDMKRMNALVEINPGALMVRVQAGIVLEELNDALEARGLMLGHDPWSRGIATVGGAISTNGVGYLAAKCGTMGDQVLDLEVVLPTGSLVEAKTTSTAAGPRLFSLCVGGEGVFGIVTVAVLRVFPKPEARLLRAVEFPDFAAGYGAIIRMAQRGVRPSMIDYTETPNEGRRPLLALAFEGLRAEAGVHVEAGLAVCAEYGGRDAGAKTAVDFWDTRHATAEGWKERNAKGRRFARGQWGGRRSGWFDYLHFSLTPEKVLAYRERAAQMVAAAGCEVREFGIWGRADLFSIGVVGPAEAQEKGAALVELLVTMAQDMGGSMEYCHGVGLKLRSFMPRERGEGLEALKRIKRALDPNNILNPGKLGLD